MPRIRLTRKLAAIMNGIDVSKSQVGDIIELPDSAALMMIAEGWGEAVDTPGAGRKNVPDETLSGREASADTSGTSGRTK